MTGDARKLAAEGLGTAFLLAIVVGSGIMGDRLSTDDAIALLGNTIATGAGLVVLIMVFGPASGAHFNPAVTLSFWMQGQITARLALLYVMVQIIGGLIGVGAAHAMFAEPLLQMSVKARSTSGEMLGELIATFALVFTIIACVRRRPEAVPVAVGLIITAGYWFTSSTSFANPAVTIARTWTNTFAGIEGGSVPGFLIAQIIGAVVATVFANWLYPVAQTEVAAKEVQPQTA